MENCISENEFMSTKCGVQVCLAIVLNLIMHLPYYFQYYTTECWDESCECPNGNLSIGIKPINLMQIGRLSFMGHRMKSNTGNETIYWTHCWSDFMNSAGWDIWYAAYQV